MSSYHRFYVLSQNLKGVFLDVWFLWILVLTLV